MDNGYTRYKIEFPSDYVALKIHQKVKSGDIQLEFDECNGTLLLGNMYESYIFSDICRIGSSIVATPNCWGGDNVSLELKFIQVFVNKDTFQKPRACTSG